MAAAGLALLTGSRPPSAWRVLCLHLSALPGLLVWVETLYWLQGLTLKQAAVLSGLGAVVAGLLYPQLALAVRAKPSLSVVLLLGASLALVAAGAATAS